MKEAELEARYRELMARRGIGDRAECVTPEELLRLAERTGPESERIRLLNHVMACEACRREYELLVAAVEMKPTRRARQWTPLAAAAAILLLVAAGVVWQTAGIQSGGDVLRGPERTVTLVAPEPGRAPSAGLNFIWRGVEDAEEYRLEVLDPSGAPVFSAVTADTFAALPDSVVLGQDGTYSWWVRASLPDGTVRSSEMGTLEAP